MDHPSAKTRLTLRCPAKLNLTLAVGPPRADGLHPITSVMVALDFGDDLRLVRLDHGPSTFARCFANDAPKSQPIDWPIESDLLFRAHAQLEQASQHSLPIACELLKRIPAGAGLGGGSSNAAGMLVGLRELFGLAMSDDVLVAIAQGLGADVVFLVHAMLGRPASLVTGIGEVIEPLPNLSGFDAVLVFPDGACPTAEVYRAYDTLTKDTAVIPASLPQAWAKNDALPAAHNDLTQAAERVCPAITPAIRLLASLGVQPRLTGSGSALFAVAESGEQAQKLAKTVSQAGFAACAVRFSNQSV